MPKPANSSSNDFDAFLALAKAEKEAKLMIDEARKRRLAILKKTKDDSFNETEAYRRACDDHMKKMTMEYSTGQDLVVNKFIQETNQKHAELRRQYESSYKYVLQTLLDRVIHPKLEYHENLRP
jgi:ATP synthase subunit G